MNIYIFFCELFPYLYIKKKYPSLFAKYHSSYDKQKVACYFRFIPITYSLLHLNKYSINTSIQPWIREESAHLRKGSQWLETFDQIVEECFIGDKGEEVSYSRQLRLSEPGCVSAWMFPSSFFEWDAISPGGLPAMIESSCSISNCVTTVYSRNPIVR